MSAALECLSCSVVFSCGINSALVFPWNADGNGNRIFWTGIMTRYMDFPFVIYVVLEETSKVWDEICNSLR